MSASLACPRCGQANPPANGFCRECAAPLAGARTETGPTLAPSTRTQFTLPDYLLAARERAQVYEVSYVPGRPMRSALGSWRNALRSLLPPA